MLGVSNIGACYGSIPSVKGLELVFVSYRDDGFTEVFQVMSSDQDENSKKAEFLTVGYLTNGKFEASKDKNISKGKLEVDFSGIPQSLIIKDILGHKQKDIRIKAFDPNLSPSDF